MASLDAAQAQAKVLAEGCWDMLLPQIGYAKRALHKLTSISLLGDDCQGHFSAAIHCYNPLNSSCVISPAQLWRPEADLMAFRPVALLDKLKMLRDTNMSVKD